ncbi:glycoside hydrolase family 43 protein [Rouxiella badensis]|uniref:glycoside hydrolase family 43 protein n=1 Tax=Rouxiella badensis TaxID=1646377 RepID=UPI001787D4DA|nr:glycoside hydrolase family 43 protein [Rouxiella badensis]QOI56585.1 family 43 glycosylhydrolase [Rouxiella badensis subsp. acadiensis]
MKKLRLIALIISSIVMLEPALAAENLSTSDNDTNGNLINAHAGGVFYENGTYYWYGEYRSPKPKNNAHWDSNQKVTMYKSRDMHNWEYIGVALDLSNSPENWDLERPKIIYNEKNKQYVMWVHLEPQRHYVGGYAGVAVSNKISGPYKLINYSRLNQGIKPINNDQGKNGDTNAWAADNTFRKFMPTGQQVRDLTLFVDDNKKAYLIYESEDDLSLQVAELNSDYTSTTGNYSRVLIGEKNEAPTVFKKNGKYYLITSGLSGYNANAARSATADNIMGPWQDLGNPVYSQNSDDVSTTFHSQPSYIFKDPKSGNLLMLADKWDTTEGGYKNLWKSTYSWQNIKFIDGKPKLAEPQVSK